MTATVTGILTRQKEVPAGVYAQALRHVWAHEHPQAIEVATQGLADDPEGAHIYALYRLWIEVLAQEDDRVSLIGLGEHLFMRGQADPSEHATFAALRGLVHIELDEFDGARLLADTLVDFVEDPYCMELCSRVAARRGESEAIEFLLSHTESIHDFFVWQTVARILLQESNLRELSLVLAHVESFFPGSMMATLHEFHFLVEQQQFLSAVHAAQRLHDRYPKRSDYAFNLGYAWFMAGEVEQAIGPLNHAMRGSGDRDIDILKMLGFCHADLGENDKAHQYLHLAASVSEEEGFPTTDIRERLTQLSGQQLQNNNPRMWLVKMSPRRHAEMVSCRRGDIDHIVTDIGTEAIVGDYCFFAADSHAHGEEASDHWRIVSIYRVESTPVWHPTDGHQTVLRLVERPAVGIPVPVQYGANGKVARSPIFELEVDALEIITEAARRYSRGEASTEQFLSVRGA